VGLVARHLEAAGIATVVISRMRVPMERVKPPRTLLVGGDRGQTIGAPGDRTGQRAVVAAALRLLAEATEPGQIQVHAG
jgi:D-proline reductase (dithiol) PrdB